MARIRVLIAEDQGMVLGALAALLDIEADIEVVGTARDGQDALAQASSIDPDVVITDIEMPRMTGLELAGELRQRQRGAARASSSSRRLRARAICAARWTPACPAICSRTLPPTSWPTPFGACIRACASSIRSWPRTHGAPPIR